MSSMMNRWHVLVMLFNRRKFALDDDTSGNVRWLTSV
jgi:hypothetical protein